MHVLLIAGWAQPDNALAPLAATFTDGPEVTETSAHSLGAGKQAYAANLAEIIRSIPEPPVVIGWSMGGIIALEAITRHQALPRSLILISSTARFCRTDGYPCGVPARSVKAMQLGLKKAPERTLKTFFRALAAPNRIENSALAEYVTDALAIGVEPLKRALDYLIETDLRGDLSRIQVPALVMHGKQDTIIPFGASECLANSLPQGRLWLDTRWGHDLPIRAAASVSKAISEFLEE